MIRAFRIAAALVLAAALVAPAPVLGWANNGDGYGTHDWVVDQAVKVLDGRASGWFDPAIARLHSDDPDKVRDKSLNEHVYRGSGRVGGGVDRIAYHYDLARAAYDAADYDEASKQIGLMAHYVGDLAQPYHTSPGAIGADEAHAKYEGLAAPLHRSKNDTPQWSSDRRTVSTFANIRDKAAGTAAYSRQFWKELHGLLKDNGFRLSGRVSEITGLVFKRAANDLADMIWSISQGVGAQPALGRIDVDVRWTGVKGGTENTVWVRAFDVDGKPIEGLSVDLLWPTSTGTRTERMYTLPDGRAKRHNGVGTSPKLQLRPVRAVATIRGDTVVGRNGWTISPRLADGKAGFKTVVSDATVVAGQVVKVTSTARDANGRGIPDLLVTWTWDFNGTKVKTKAYTNDRGKASSSRTIDASTTRTKVTVAAATQSGSVNRSSSTSFRRTD